MLHDFFNVPASSLEAQVQTVVTVAAACMTARALHARLLSIAAARRLRAAERLAGRRVEDAEFWLGAAPFALGKATEMRASALLARLP